MTFLELCQRLRSEAGIAGSGPSAVTGQTGELGRIVNWVESAYQDIQNIHPTWRFLRESFSASITSGTQNYSASDLSITDLRSWKIYGDDDYFSIYSSVSDESELTYIEWEGFRRNYLFGTARSATDRPTIVTVKPDNSLSFYATPNSTYTVTGEYYKTADVFADGDASPVIPTQYQMIIVWKALMLYGAYSAAQDAYAHGEREYRNYLRKMEYDQLPELTYGEPLV